LRGCLPGVDEVGGLHVGRDRERIRPSFLLPSIDCRGAPLGTILLTRRNPGLLFIQPLGFAAVGSPLLLPFTLPLIRGCLTNTTRIRGQKSGRRYRRTVPVAPHVECARGRGYAVWSVLMRGEADVSPPRAGVLSPVPHSSDGLSLRRHLLVPSAMILLLR